MRSNIEPMKRRGSFKRTDTNNRSRKASTIARKRARAQKAARLGK